MSNAQPVGPLSRVGMNDTAFNHRNVRFTLKFGRGGCYRWTVTIAE